jgi:hypothetical protein
MLSVNCTNGDLPLTLFWDPLSTAAEYNETFLSLAMLGFPNAFWNSYDSD